MPASRARLPLLETVFVLLSSRVSPQAMATDPNFIRLTKGAYSLHCFHPNKPNLIRDPAHKKRKMTDFLGGSSTGRQGAVKLQTALEMRISPTCVSCMILQEAVALPCIPVRLLHWREAARSLPSCDATRHTMQCPPCLPPCRGGRGRQQAA